MALTEAEFQVLLSNQRAAAGELPAKAKQPKPRMNKTETRFSQHLEMRHRLGEISWWAFQPMTFRLAADCRYTPDFAVLFNESGLTMYDTKGAKNKPDGTRTYWCEEDAKIKIRVAAEMFPFFRWVICFQEKNGEWREVAF